MASIPGHCPHCGAIFEGLGGIHVRNSTNVTVVGGKMTCPNCGQLANLVDGTFSEYGAGLELVSGPPLTKAVLAQLHEVARRAQSKEITPEEAVAQARAIDPYFGGLIEKFLNLGMPALAVLIGLIGLYLQHESGRSTETFQQEALRLLKRQTEAAESMVVSEKSKNDGGVQYESGRPPNPEAKEKTSPAKSKSKRRQDVNKNRRDALKERRKMSPPRKHGR